MIKQLFFTALCSLPALALAAHGISLGQPPRYAAGFAHFQYANPAAPKGGSFSLPVAGGFDTLNPFTLKGDHEAGVATLTLDTLMAKSDDEPFAMYGLLAEDVPLA